MRHKLTLTEEVNLARNWPLLKLLATSGIIHPCDASLKCDDVMLFCFSDCYIESRLHCIHLVVTGVVVQN